MTDFSDIKGLFLLKRVVEISIAGSHSLFLIGPSCCGKSMFLNAIKNIDHTGRLKVIDDFDFKGNVDFLFNDFYYVCSVNTFSLFNQSLIKVIQILEKFDLVFEIPCVDVNLLLNNTKYESSVDVKKRIDSARDIQKIRYKKSIKSNGNLEYPDFKKYCKCEKDSLKLLQIAVKRLEIDVKEFIKIMKISRTISDLNGSENILVEHMQEALQFVDSSIT
jgi:predicted ATPase with chaperone activity